MENKMILRKSTTIFWAPLSILFFINFDCLAQGPGDLDNSFGNNGKAFASFNVNGQVAPSSAVIQSDGKILQFGLIGGDISWIVVRYNNDGTLDNSFGDAGISKIPLDNLSLGGTIKLLPNDGKILLIGTILSSGSSADGILIRLNSNGSIDNSFGNIGYVITPLSISSDYFWDAAIQSDGKIVAVGQFGILVNNKSDFAIVRYNPDGTLDNSFSNDGVQNVDFGGINEYATALSIQADGKIVVAGVSDALNNTISDIAIVRLQTNGSIDQSFGANGKILKSLGDGNDYIISSVIQSDGKILLGGGTWEVSKSSACIMRYLSSGVSDNSFGSGGIIVLNHSFPTGTGQITLQQDGKIVLCGNVDNGSNSDVLLARYHLNGSLDQSFGNSGIVTTDFGTDKDYSQKIMIQTDGKLVIAGGAFNRFVVARYFSGINVGASNPAKETILGSVYPNPTKQNFTLEYELLEKATINIDLNNLSGSRLKKIISEDVQSSGKHKINVALDDDLMSGTYFLRITTGSRVAMIKILKQ